MDLSGFCQVGTTNNNISRVCKAHLVFVATVAAAVGWYVWKGYNSIALFMVLVANLFASYGMVKVGRLDYTELGTIGEEISKPYRTRA